MSNILCTTESISAFAIAQAALLNCRVAGMVAANQERMSNGQALAYGQDAFYEVETEFGRIIGSNELLNLYAQVSI